jgi:VanZ like family
LSLRELTQELRDYVGFGPGVAISLVVSLVACGYVSRALTISKAHGWALLMSLGVILAATITPSREAILFGAQGSGTCDLGRIGPGSWWELTHLDDASLNILLFVPLGIALGLLPRSHTKLVIVMGGFMLPVAIELFQLVVVRLGRECQSSDIVDNLCGLLLGLLVGSVAGWIWSLRPAGSVANADKTHH